MDDNTPKAAKDKECPYCRQAFTSSSLGRHLDLYIKPRNPKKPDGIHDVEEIRRTRGGVTRRQPKGSGMRRQTSTPAATPAGPSQQASQRTDGNGDSDEDESMVQSPSKEPSVSAPATSAAGFPIGRGNRWEAVNTAQQRQQQQHSHEGDRLSRNLNRLAQKNHLDASQRLQDALDEARAAELAFREITQAVQAAQQRVETGNSPFAFDPITMDFPALVLQCLPAMPTLFALTQLPTASSWSTLPPGDGQFESLKAHFTAEYQKFKARLIAQAEAQQANFGNAEARQQAVEAAASKADDLARLAMEHVDNAYANWNEMESERQTELWVLNLARGLATRQNENVQHVAEIADLKNHVKHLASQLSPQHPQATGSAGGLPFSSRILHELPGFDGTLSSDDFVNSTIQRWKDYVTTQRLQATGMSAQRPLEMSTTVGPATPTGADRGVPTRQPTRARPGGVKFSNSTPESVAQITNAQRAQRMAARAPGRQPVPSGSGSRAAPAAVSTAAPTGINAPPAPVPAAPANAPAPVQEQPSQTDDAVETKTEPVDEMDVEVDEAEADEEEDDEEEEEEEEDEDEDADDAEADDAEEAEDDDDEDGDDDTTPPAHQSQQAPAGPGTGGRGGSSRNNNNRNNTNADNDDDDEMSDKDADAEMEDDGDEFAHMHTPLVMSMSSTGSETQPQSQTQSQSGQVKTQPPEFAYSRNNAAHIPRTAGNTSASLINSGRLMPSMGLPMPTMSSESMYMD